METLESLTVDDVVGIATTERYVVLQQVHGNVCLPLDTEVIVFPVFNDAGKLITVTVDATFRVI